MSSRLDFRPKSFVSEGLGVAVTLLLLTTLLFLHLAIAEKAEGGARDHSVYSVLTTVPAKAAARRNPLQDDPESVAAGSKLFSQHCAECHGAVANGGKKAPSLRAEQVRTAAPGTLFWVLTNGVVRRGMPVWSKLPEPQRWQIVTYLKSLPPEASDPQPAEVESKPE